MLTYHAFFFNLKLRLRTFDLLIKTGESIDNTGVCLVWKNLWTMWITICKACKSIRYR